MPRTTIDLDDALYRVARKVAIDHDKTFKQVVQEALQRYVIQGGSAIRKPRRDAMPRAYPARIRGALSRREIYEYLDARFSPHGSP